MKRSNLWLGEGNYFGGGAASQRRLNGRAPFSLAEWKSTILQVKEWRAERKSAVQLGRMGNRHSAWKEMEDGGIVSSGEVMSSRGTIFVTTRSAGLRWGLLRRWGCLAMTGGDSRDCIDGGAVS